jgi:hypothetical protein
MPDAIVEFHKPPACKDQHNPDCKPAAGYTEVCGQFGDFCVCVHWPPPGAYTRDGGPGIEFIDNRETRKRK